VIDTVTPILQWKAVSNAEYYALAISTHPYGPAYVIYRNEQIYGTSLILPRCVLVYGGKYRWNMQAYNSAGWSDLSTTLYFQTPTSSAQKPDPPVPTAPGSSTPPGPTIDTLTPTLQWEAVSNADYYALAISKDPYGAANIIYRNEEIYGTSLVLPSGVLVHGEKYRWNMQAHNSAGWSDVSGILYFQTLSAGPIITGVSPSPVVGSNDGQTLTITGEYFVSDSAVTLRTGGSVYPIPSERTTFVNPSRIEILANLTANPGSWTAQVINPGDVPSDQFSFDVVAPAPEITSLEPSSCTEGEGDLVLKVNGNDFNLSSVVHWNGADRTTTRVETSPGSELVAWLEADIPASDIATAGTAQVTVFNPSPGGGTSDALVFTIIEGQTFYIGFPLPNRGPYTATINAVFDHSMISPYAADGIVIAYTGEEGRSQYGQDYVITIGENALYGFKNSTGTDFSINGSYSGGGSPDFLYYDGHPGYDYRTIDQSPDGQIDVLAAADGLVHCVSGSEHNTIYIDHGNGYTTHYLHLSQRVASDGATMTRGQVIGVSGDAGAPGAPHLHFEVRFNGVPVDPYGWGGAGSDPYTHAPSEQLWGPVAEAISFDKNNIISDEQLTNFASMTLEEIQDFLHLHGSVLAGYSFDGRSAAQHIYDACQEHRVNPQVVLVALQKEQGLILSSTASQERLNLAMGWDPSGIYDSHNFGDQVYWGTWQFRRCYENLQSYVDTKSVPWSVGEPHAVMDGTVTPGNRATAVLYIYTNWIGGPEGIGGNYLFWDLWYNTFQFGIGQGMPMLELSTDIQSGDFSLSWQGLGGRRYQIEASDDLLNWSAQEVIESTGDGQHSWLDLGSATLERRFYRVLMLTD